LQALEQVVELDPIDTIEKANEAARDAASRLNMSVAVTVALLATFMGICKVKDDNIVQAMQQSQANKLDHWAFYQARNIREEVARSTLVQLQLQAAEAHAPERYQAAIANYERLVAEQEKKKTELKAQADQDQKDYDAANFRDDQFDLSDAFLAIAVAVLAVTSLTRQRWLYGLAMVPTVFGVLMGLAGLCGWPIHPGWLTSLFS
jgi:ribosomal protein S13